MTRQFAHLAAVITQQIAELLQAQVWVVDQRGQAIASSGPERSDGGPQLEGQAANALRVPIRFAAEVGEVIVAPPPKGETLSPRLTKALVELMVDQTLVRTHLPQQHELKNKFIHDLLRGPKRDEAELLREGQMLGMDFSRPRAVILIDATDYLLPLPGQEQTRPEAELRRRSQQIINSIVSFFHLPNDTICADIGNGEVAVLKASTSHDLFAWTDQGDRPGQTNPSWANLTALKRAGSALLLRLRRDTGATLSIGIGRHHPGLLGLARSYQDARAALSLGRRCHGQNRVHCLDQLGIAAFIGIADENTKIELAQHLLSPLEQETELLATLEAFFATNCSPSQTAQQLSIHRNTLSYRLDKITSLIGLDPRCFDQAMQIRLALLLRSLQGESSSLGRCPIFHAGDRPNPGQMSDVSHGAVIQHR